MQQECNGLKHSRLSMWQHPVGSGLTRRGTTSASRVQVPEVLEALFTATIQKGHDSNAPDLGESRCSVHGLVHGRGCQCAVGLESEGHTEVRGLRGSVSGKKPEGRELRTKMPEGFEVQRLCSSQNTLGHGQDRHAET